MTEAAVEGAPGFGPGVVDAVLVTDLCGRVKQTVHVRGVPAFYSDSVVVTVTIVTSSITLATSPSVKESITIDRNKIEKMEYI